MSESTIEEELLTRSELCKKLKISKTSLRTFLKNKNFPRLKIGGDYRFIYSDVLAFMKDEAKKAVN
jgi:excisionase family DNA binding protein